MIIKCVYIYETTKRLSARRIRQEKIDLKVETHITFQKEVKPASFLVAIWLPYYTIAAATTLHYNSKNKI